MFGFGNSDRGILENLAEDIFQEEKQDATGMRANFSLDSMLGSGQDGGSNAADHFGTFANMGNNMFGDGEKNQFTDFADQAANQFGNGPKRPKETGNQYIDTFNDYNT